MWYEETTHMSACALRKCLLGQDTAYSPCGTCLAPASLSDELFVELFHPPQPYKYMWVRQSSVSEYVHMRISHICFIYFN